MKDDVLLTIYLLQQMFPLMLQLSHSHEYIFLNFFFLSYYFLELLSQFFFAHFDEWKKMENERSKWRWLIVHKCCYDKIDTINFPIPLFVILPSRVLWFETLHLLLPFKARWKWMSFKSTWIDNEYSIVLRSLSIYWICTMHISFSSLSFSFS